MKIGAVLRDSSLLLSQPSQGLDTDFAHDGQLGCLDAFERLTRDADLGVGIPFQTDDPMTHEAINVP